MSRCAPARQGAWGSRRLVWTVAATLVLLSPLAASAASLCSEDFSYAAGSQLVGQGGWAAHSVGGTNPITVATPGLTYPGYAGSGIGNLVGMASSGEDDDHGFTSQTSGAVYAGFLVNVQTATTTGDYFLHLMVSSGSTLFYGRVYVKKDATGNTFGFGVRHSSAGTIPFTPTTYAFGTTHLIVVKYLFNGGSSNDVVSLWVDPPLGGAEPLPTLTHSGADGPGTDATAIAGISLRQGSSTSASTQQVDGIRVGTAWADIAGTTVNHTITASAGAGGAISPSGAVAVADGSSQMFTITPNPCFSIADVQVDGASQGAVASYTFTAVTTDHTIAASFTANGPYSIAASAGAGGTIVPSGAVSVACGGSQSFSIAPDACHTLADVVVDGASVGAVASYAFTNVAGNHTIAASFATIAYTITASAGTGGTITPSGAVPVTCGASQAFTIGTSAGYTLGDVTVDGASVGAVTTYTFTNVTASHSIAATWIPDPATVTVASSPTTVCPANACVTLPVQLSRVSTAPMLAYSVTFQLSANLALCAGTSSIVEGPYLSSSGTTLFHAVDHGGGSYTVDDATVTCGPTATSGVLFTIDVTSGAAGGTGTVTITSVKLRDCANAPMAVNAGPAATVPIDNQAPAVALVSPVGGETWVIGTQHAIQWTASDNTAVAAIDLAYSSDGGATFPNVIALGLANSGSYDWTVPNATPSPIRVRVVAHDAACSSASAASGDVVVATTSVGDGAVVTELAPVSPSPSRGSATLRFGVGARGAVDLAIYSVDGRRVRTLASGVHDVGRYQVAWDGRDDAGTSLRSGVFYARLEVAGQRRMRVVTLVR